VFSELKPQRFAVIKSVLIVHIRELFVPGVDEVIKLPVGVGLALTEEIAELHEIVFVVTVANSSCNYIYTW
jgi:hypothetical protein